MLFDQLCWLNLELIYKPIYFTVRTALLALIGFMPTFGEGALGSLEYTADERKTLARKYYKTVFLTNALLKLLISLK